MTWGLQSIQNYAANYRTAELRSFKMLLTFTGNFTASKYNYNH